MKKGTVIALIAAVILIAFVPLFFAEECRVRRLR